MTVCAIAKKKRKKKSFALAQIDSVFVAKFKRNNKNTQELAQELRRTRDRKKRKKVLSSFCTGRGESKSTRRAGEAKVEMKEKQRGLSVG